MSKTRELGEPTKADRKEIKESAEFLTLDAWSVERIEEILLGVWALGHNQGYEDANTEREER